MSRTGFPVAEGPSCGVSCLVVVSRRLIREEGWVDAQEIRSNMTEVDVVVLDDPVPKEEVAAHFLAPAIQHNPDGWGPCELPDQFKDIPYQPFSKGDRLGKVSVREACSHLYPFHCKHAHLHSHCVSRCRSLTGRRQPSRTKNSQVRISSLWLRFA